MLVVKVEKAVDEQIQGAATQNCHENIPPVVIFPAERPHAKCKH